MMQGPLASNGVGNGLRGSNAFSNWNWGMQNLQQTFTSAQSNNLGFGTGNAGRNESTENWSSSTSGNSENSGGIGNPGNGDQINVDMNNCNNQEFININQAMIVNINAPMTFNASQHQQHHQYQQQQASAQQQQSLQPYSAMNRLNPMNPLMFQNSNVGPIIPFDGKVSETIKTSNSSYDTKMTSDESNLNQYNLKKERLSPLPSWFNGLCPSYPNYPGLATNNSNFTSEPISDGGLNNFGGSGQFTNSTSTGVVNSNQKGDLVLPTTHTQLPYFPNPLHNPLSSFWGGGFMYNNPSQYAQYLNHTQPLPSSTNNMAPGQMLGHPLPFPNPHFNPFVVSAEMAAAAALHNGYFPPNLQQHAFFQQQQQQHEQFMALTHQQQPPIIKQEDDTIFQPLSPKIEEEKKLEEDRPPSLHTEEEDADKTVKPRKSSKCQCPNCTNPQPEDESMKAVKKHACHWPGCPKTYGKTSHLKSHIRQHQGIRPFICPDQTCLKVILKTNCSQHEITF